MRSHRKPLIQLANAFVTDDEVLLAMEESTGTCHKRFATTGIPETEEARRSYRELRFSREPQQETNVAAMEKESP